MIGQKVIVRSSASGCWHGVLVSLDGQTARLAEARRLWRWWAAEGVSLSGVAAKGLRTDKLRECEIEPAVDAIVFEVCEVLAATDAASASIEAQPWAAR